VGNRPYRNDPLWVYESVGPEVVSLDVVKVRGVLERGVFPVQLLHPPVDIRISMADITDVTFEVSDVDRIEADDSDPKPDVSFCELITDEEFLALERLFDLVQGLEHFINCSLICFGAARKTGLVNAVIDSIVNPIVNGVDFLTKFLGINVDFGLINGDKIVELRIEDSDDLGALVIHDFLIFLVPEHRNREPSGIAWLGFKI